MTVVIQQKLAGVEKDVSDVNNAVVRESSDIRREIINHGEEEMRKVAICSHCILSIWNIYLFPALVLRAGFAFLLHQFLFIAFLLLLE